MNTEVRYKELLICPSEVVINRRQEFRMSPFLSPRIYCELIAG